MIVIKRTKRYVYFIEDNNILLHISNVCGAMYSYRYNFKNIYVEDNYLHLTKIDLDKNKERMVKYPLKKV